MTFALQFGLLLAVASTSLAVGAEEELLPFSEVRIVAAERKETGRVSLTAKFEKDEYREVVIEAFGKEYKLEKLDVARLNGFPLSSLQITHEAGFVTLGGHTVYFKFKRPGTDPAATLQGTIIVSKNKGLALSGFISIPPAGGR